MDKHIITILPDGDIVTIHCDELSDLYTEGKTEIRRASHVEPTDHHGQVMWTADMEPSGGPVLGPFPSRSQALIAEIAWLNEHTLGSTST